MGAGLGTWYVLFALFLLSATWNTHTMAETLAAILGHEEEAPAKFGRAMRQDGPGH